MKRGVALEVTVKKAVGTKAMITGTKDFPAAEKIADGAEGSRAWTRSAGGKSQAEAEGPLMKNAAVASGIGTMMTGPVEAAADGAGTMTKVVTRMKGAPKVLGVGAAAVDEGLQVWTLKNAVK